MKVPEGIVSPNVEGHRLVGPLQGFGKMWQRNYKMRLEGARRYGADAQCGVGNISYTSSMIYGWMGDVFGERRSFSSIGLRHHQTA